MGGRRRESNGEIEGHFQGHGSTTKVGGAEEEHVEARQEDAPVAANPRLSPLHLSLPSEQTGKTPVLLTSPGTDSKSLPDWANMDWAADVLKNLDAPKEQRTAIDPVEKHGSSEVPEGHYEPCSKCSVQ